MNVPVSLSTCGNEWTDQIVFANGLLLSLSLQVYRDGTYIYVGLW
jgi:hypothetical protein